MKLKKYKKKKVSTYLTREFILVLISITLAIFIINYYADKCNQVIMPIAEEKVRKHLTEVINNSTHDITFSNSLYTINKNNNNEINMITYNSYEATSLINQITQNIQNNLDNDLIIDKIPLGVINNNALLKNIGPKIKINFILIGDVLSELETEVKPYGINNALVELRIKLIANARIILPLTSKDITFTNNIPLSINIVNGHIPEAYIGSYHN